MSKHKITFVLLMFAALFALPAGAQLAAPRISPKLFHNRMLPKTVMAASQPSLARAAAVVSGELPASNLPDLRGCVSICPGHDNGESHSGVYDIFNMKRLRMHMDLSAAFGGTALHDGKYFTTLVELDDYGTVIYLESNIWNSLDEGIPYRNVATEVRNMVTGEGQDLNIMALALCTDYVTGIVYGIFYSSDLQSYEFATLDVEGFYRTGHIQRGRTIATVDQDIEPASMSSASDGTLYMIDCDGKLYTVDKTTGRYTQVASTGMASPYYTDGAIDPRTDIYYFFHYPGDDLSRWAVKGIDLRNAYKVTTVSPIGCQFGGAYIADPVVSDKVPAAPTDVKAEFAGGNLSGTVSFSVPTTFYDGTQATGAVEYGIVFNEEVVATGSTTWGTTAKIPVTIKNAGEQRMLVFLKNSAGKGPGSEPQRIWTGNGKPSVPAGISAEINRTTGVVSLAWDAVTTAVLDGFIVPGEVTYTVTRYKDGVVDKVVADGLTTPAYDDRLEGADKPMVAYRYGITAKFRGNTSDEGLSKVVPNGRIFPPYATEFSTPTDLDLYTVIDGGNDNFTWAWSDYYECIGLDWDNIGTRVKSDEWLITQPVNLKAGHVYVYKLVVHSRSSYNTLQVFMGNTPTAAGMTTALTERTYLFESNVTTKEIVANIIPEADGAYYIGLHHDFGGPSTPQTDYVCSRLQLISMDISEGFGLGAPDVVTDVTFKPQYDGSNKTDLSFKAPVKAVNGGTLGEITRIEVKRDGKLVKTFENPATGAPLTYRDRVTQNDDYNYTITGYNSHGTGYHYEQKVHVGLNLASAPTDVKISEVAGRDGYVNITWTPAKTDILGNEINPNLVQYLIHTRSEAFNQELIPASDPSFTFRAVPEGQQAFVQYYVSSITNNMMGGNAITDLLPVGTPHSLPYIETFEGGLQPTYISTVTTDFGRGTGGHWYVRITDGTTSMPAGMEPLTVTSQDEGDGLIGWHPEYGRPYSTRRLTGKIKLDDTDDVALSYYFYGVPGLPDFSFYNFIVCDGEVTNLTEVMNIADVGTRGWKEVRIPLKEWRGKTVQLGWYVECDAPEGHYSNEFEWYGVFIMDNIQVRRWTPRDLAARRVAVPAGLKVGQESTFSVKIVNEGTERSEACSVGLLRDGVCEAVVELPAIEPSGETEATFKVIPSNFWKSESQFTARIVWEADQQQWNNESKAVSGTVTPSYLDGVADLHGSIDGRKATLGWSALVSEPELTDIDENCENLGSFSLDPDAFGPWTVRDAKPEGALMRSRYYNWPCAKEQQAWIVHDKTVYNNGSVKFTVDDGNKMLVSWSATNVANDNWLISPLLSGEAQTVTFDAASWGYYAAEHIEVLASSTGMETADFTKINDYYLQPADEDEEAGDVTTIWNKVSADLPAGTRYFAIRNVSDGTKGEYTAAMIDNIRCRGYISSHNATGYNVYRDGVRLNAAPLGEPGFVEENLLPGTYTYHVEAIFADGSLSRLSNPVELTVEEYRLDAGLKFDPEFVDVVMGEEFTVPTLTKATDAPVSYETNNAAVAAVDAATGVITVKGEGTAIIEATTPGTETYRPGRATYVISVRRQVGIDSAAAGAGFNVGTVPGYIIISGVARQVVTIHNAAGLQLWRDEVADKARVGVVPGVYIVSCGNRAVKVMVR